MGLGTVVIQAHQETGVDLTRLKQGTEPNGPGGDKYAGFDRFPRVVDQRWLRAGIDLDRSQNWYDRNWNVRYQDNLLNDDFDELYHADGGTAEYDDLDRMTEFQRGPLSDSNANGVFDTVLSASRDVVYNMDAQSNFTSTVTTVNGGSPSTQTRGHNAQNEITSISAATTPGYDANGNTTTDETGQTFTFDAWNRLVEVKTSGGTTLANYKYDAQGWRIQETVSGTTRHFFFSNAWQVLEERVGTETNADIHYVWSPIYVDALLLRDRDANNDNGALEERLYVLYDANYNVTGLVNTSGNIVERFVDDPYGGNIIALNPDWTTYTGADYAWKHFHQGLRYESATGLFDNRARWYSPTLMRFVSMDPIGFPAGYTNLYVAYGNGPTNGRDPSGYQGLPAAAPLQPVDAAFTGIPNQQGFTTTNTLGGIWASLRARKLKGEGKCLKQLEIGGHCGGDTTFLGGNANTGTRSDENADSIGNANIKYVINQLNSLVDWCCPCVIYMSSCHAGIQKGGGNYPQTLANGTGCFVMAPMGFVTGSISNNDWKVSQDTNGSYPETETDHASRSNVWRLYSPRNPNKNKCDKPCNKDIIQRHQAKGEQIYVEPPQGIAHQAPYGPLDPDTRKIKKAK